MGGSCGRQTKWDNVGEDVVVLHGFPRSKILPNMSPFVVKLETFLRMNNIKYEFDGSGDKSPKGKVPWVTFNGEDIGDSELIIDKLNQHFNKDLNSSLSSEEKAIARAFQVTTDEHMFWGLLWWRLVKDPQMYFLKVSKLPAVVKWVLPLLRYAIRKRIQTQGLGTHSDADLIDFIRKDLQAISEYLGTKPFMMGDEPTQVDCSIYGMTLQVVHASPGSPFQFMVEKDFPNLGEYCERMKARYYEDWDSLLWKP